MAEIHRILGPFFQLGQERNKPVSTDLFAAQGFNVSGATQEELGRLIREPELRPTMDDIPGTINNVDPGIQQFKNEFRTFVENVPLTQARELRHPSHFMEGVPGDPMVNMIHLDSQRRRMESMYAFV